MIQAQVIYTQLQSLLDANGASYYDANLDFIPAVNRAQKYICSLINSILGGKKFAEEHYRELVKCLIFQTSQYSRVDFTPSQPIVVWDILNILANPTLNTAFTPTVVPNNLSAPRPDLFYVSGGDACERLNVMEYRDAQKDPFKGGYNAEPTGKNLQYAYNQYVDYFNGLFNVPNEIEISPAVNQQPVAIFFVKMPSDIAALGDNIQFPATFTDTITKATFREIAIKQGDNTTNFEVATQDIMNYIKSLA